MPDLHSWTGQRIDKAEHVARRASSDLGTVLNRIDYQDDAVTADEEHIMFHDPRAVLRRCAADRKALALHRPEPGQHPDFCGYDKHELPCPGLCLLAEAYGWEGRADA